MHQQCWFTVSSLQQAISHTVDSPLIFACIDHVMLNCHDSTFEVMATTVESDKTNIKSMMEYATLNSKLLYYTSVIYDCCYAQWVIISYHGSLNLSMV